MINDYWPHSCGVVHGYVMHNRFAGYVTALITPFKNGKVDEAAFQRHIEWQIEEGIHGIVPHGTTGESPTLQHGEVARLFNLAVEASAGRVPVIAGCGANSTAEAIALTKLAQEAGCDGNLQVSPYYNKPTQEGLYQHFKAVHDATGLPIVLYDVPGRTVVKIDVDTQARLAKLPRIVGVKDATGDLTRPIRTKLSCAEPFAQLTGEDALIVPFLAQGGDGCISVTSNIAPGLCVDLYHAWNRKDFATVQNINERLFPLHDALFSETSPGPVKYAASQLGICDYELRLPMVPIAAANERRVDAAMLALSLSGPK